MAWPERDVGVRTAPVERMPRLGLAGWHGVDHVAIAARRGRAVRSATSLAAKAVVAGLRFVDKGGRPNLRAPAGVDASMVTLSDEQDGQPTRSDIA